MGHSQLWLATSITCPGIFVLPPSSLIKVFFISSSRVTSPCSCFWVVLSAYTSSLSGFQIRDQEWCWSVLSTEVINPVTFPPQNLPAYQLLPYSQPKFLTANLFWPSDILKRYTPGNNSLQCLFRPSLRLPIRRETLILHTKMQIWPIPISLVLQMFLIMLNVALAWPILAPMPTSVPCLS